MTEETAALVLESFRRFDPEDLAPFAETLHPEIVMTAAEGWPETGPFLGREACVRQMERLFDDWSEYALQDVSVIEDRGDWIIVAWTMGARGRRSGLEVRLDVVGSFRVEECGIRQAHFRWNREQALEAIG